MKIDFISVNDYRKNKKHSLGNILSAIMTLILLFLKE
jgi:hypothetical protein